FIGGGGSNTLYLGAAAGADTVYVTSSGTAATGNNIIVGSAGDNLFAFDPSQGALRSYAVLANPSAASNTLDFSAFDHDQPVNVDLSLTSAHTICTNVLTLTLASNGNGDNGIENVVGGDGNDTIFGNGRDNRLFGEGGCDVLSGGAGTNTLWGGDGDDQ